MATRNAAEHLGTNALGTIEAGKVADLILIDSDPTVDISALRDVLMVVKDGKIIVDYMQRH
jgi:enamidase